MKSSDSAKTWKTATAPTADFAGGQVRFADATNGWLTNVLAGQSAGLLYATHDGGSTWHATTLTTVVNIAPVDGYVWATTGAPGTAHALYRAPIASDVFVKVADVAGTAITSSGGTVYLWDNLPTDLAAPQTALTVTDGTTSATRGLPCAVHEWSVAAAAASGSRIYVVCGSQPATGNQAKTSYLSADQGRTWTKTGQLPESGYAQTAVASDDALIVTGGRMPIDVSRDGGKTWTENLGQIASASGFTDLAMTDSKHGYAIGGLAPNRLAITADGAQTWQLIPFT